jgi:hypothetical protein
LRNPEIYHVLAWSQADVDELCQLLQTKADS